MRGPSAHIHICDISMGPIVLQVRAQQRLGFGGQRARLVTFFPRTMPLAPITR